VPVSSPPGAPSRRSGEETLRLSASTANREFFDGGTRPGVALAIVRFFRQALQKNASPIACHADILAYRNGFESDL
jgi:hypothetical protein